jgi:hypothetical protein
MWYTLALVGLLAVPTLAQSGQRSEQPPNLFFTPEIIDMVINRISDEMAKQYGLDEDQSFQTRELIKARFPAWLDEHRDQIIELTNEYLALTIDDAPPTPEQVADWSRRALPLMSDAFQMVDATAEDMGAMMTDEQRLLLDGQMAAFNVARTYMSDRMQTWSQGGYDWRSEWPRSEEFQRKERERQEQLEHEMRGAEREAIGLPPEGSGESGAVGGPGEVGDAPPPGVTPDPSRRAQAAAPVQRTKDEWETYVENFIRRYRLDEGQQNTARKHLKTAQDGRDQYLRRLGNKLEALEKRLQLAQGDEDKQKVQQELVDARKPLERYFDNLKRDLERIPTRKQKAEAALEGESGVKAALQERTRDAGRKPQPDSQAAERVPE